MKGDAAVGLALLAFIIVLVTLFTLPTIIAFGRRHSDRWLILIVNIAVGGTVVGWLVALVWALNAAHLADGHGQTDGGQSGLNLFANDAQVICVEHVQPRVVEIQVPSPPCRPTLSVAAAAHRLETLDQLHQQGWVTKTEYTALRRGLLGQL